MVPLGDEGQVEACFGLFVTWVMWNLSSFHLETVLLLMQDSCTVYDKCTVGS